MAVGRVWAAQLATLPTCQAGREKKNYELCQARTRPAQASFAKPWSRSRSRRRLSHSHSYCTVNYILFFKIKEILISHKTLKWLLHCSLKA